MNVRIIILLFFLCCPALFPGLLLCGQQPGSTGTAFIKIHNRQAGEILPQVRTLLSARGRASADSATNTLIVIDRQKNIHAIRQLVTILDRPRPRVTVLLRVRARFDGGRLLSTGGGIRGAPPGYRLAAGSSARKKELRLTMASGTKGFVAVGRRVPVTRGWIDLCARHGLRAGWLREYTTLTSGFTVRPVVLEHGVQLTLIPALGFGQGRDIVFTRAAVTVMVPPDTWTEISAATGMHEPFNAVLLAGQTGYQGGNMVLEAKVLIHEPGR